MEDKVTNGGFLQKLLAILKKHLIVLIAIILGFVGVGFAASFIDKPTYTVQELAFYKAKILESKDSPYDYTASKAYLDTVADFCRSGVVMNRANYYYEDYLQNKENYKDVDEYIKKIKDERVATKTYKDVKENPDLFMDKEVLIEATMYLGTGDTFKQRNEKFVGVFKGFNQKQDKTGSGVEVAGVKAEVITLKHIVTGVEIDLRMNNYRMEGKVGKLGFFQVREELNKVGRTDYQNTTNYAYIDDMLFSDMIKEVESDKTHIVKENLSVASSSASDDSVTFAMTVNYTDINEKVAQEKAKIIILALDNESKVCEPLASTSSTVSDYLTAYRYFGVRVSVQDKGTYGAIPSFSKKNRILICSLLGVFVSAVTVAIIMAVDGKKQQEKGDNE